MPFIKPRLIKENLEHHAKGSKYGKTHYQIHPHYVAGCPKCMGLSRSWRAGNKKIHSVTCRESRKRLKLKVIAIMGGKCVNCGASDPRILTINHKHGDGSLYRKKYKVSNGRRVYLDIAKGRIDIKTLDLRCGNCQILYEYECGRRIW